VALVTGSVIDTVYAARGENERQIAINDAKNLAFDIVKQVEADHRIAELIVS
jgi:hypothetical protein